jgi:alkylation response protein AidB-like acyl-CoA dehydrogenase
MDFEFSEQQQMFRETFRGFLADHRDLAAHAATMGCQRFDDGLWHELAGLGLFGILVPEEHGGLGLNWVDLALVIEELGQTLIGPPLTDTLVATDLFVRQGSAVQQRVLLPRIASGELRIAIAAAEPDAGCDPALLAAVATPAGDGWRLDGAKILVPEAATAGLLLVVARRGPQGPLALALIEPGRTGVAIEAHQTLDPTVPMARVTLSGVTLGVGDWLDAGAPGEDAGRLLDTAAMVASLQLIGIAGKVLDIAVAYAAQRVQFGKPIGSFQAIKHKCADMAVAIDAGRSAAYFAAWAVAESPAERACATAMAKSFCGDAARMVCNEGIQIHGGMGFTWELGLHYYLRRTKLLEFTYGDAAAHRERLIAATLAGLGVAG